MRYRSPSLALMLAAFPLMALLALGAPSVFASRTGAADDASSVTIIILDMSGSMSTNDPPGIRCSAADAYIHLSGPGDFIGVIGLDNNNGVTGGSHNFQVAQNWSNPVEMATQRAKDGLISTIAQQSNNCRPDADTPTYDALSKAEAMLAASARQGITRGQVILLTDGAPYPDPVDQINDIGTDLVPIFQQHRWPINTVALGADATDQGIDYHGFLAGLSRATSGGAYDDSKGPVNGVSPLNITPFFLDIFERFHSRVLNVDIPYTTLTGSTFARNFSVAQYADQLDVLVVKDNSSVTGVLRDPLGQVVDSSIGGVAQVNEAYFLLVSVDSPRFGLWELDLSGPPGSHVMVYDLTASTLGVEIASVTANGAGQNLFGGTNALPLGSTITVTAHLTSAGQPVSSPDFALNGEVAYKGNSGVFQQAFSLQPMPGGAYQGTIAIPLTAPVGSYGVTVVVTGASAIRPLAQSPEFAFRVALFPSALFIRCITLSGVQTCEATPDTVSTVAPEWDPALRLLYSLPGVSWLSHWALNSSTARPTAAVNGQVLVGNQTYSGATVFGSVQKVGTSQILPLAIDEHAAGKFTASFIPPSAGTYVVTLDIRGSLLNTTGDLAVVKRDVVVRFAGASGNEELLAWLKTTVYLLVLATIATLADFYARPNPYVIVAEGNRSERQEPKPMRVQIHNIGDLLRHVFRRNVVASSQLGIGPGMMIQFRRDDNRRQIMWVRETQQHSEWVDDGGQRLFRPKKRNVMNWLQRLRAHEPDSRRWTRLGYDHVVGRGRTRFKLTSRKLRPPPGQQKRKKR